MRQEATEKQERRVQHSGRPCGAPSVLDAKRSVCERPPQAKSTTLEEPFQTPNHNLIPTKSGPTIGVHLKGQLVNRKRVVRLLRLMGIEAIYPKTKTSEPGAGHRIYPYLLKGLEIKGPDEVWCADITYIPLQQGFMYLVAVMDWWSRCVLAWEISNTLESDFCVRAWEGALAQGRRTPDISNTDQGSQFTSEAYIEAVESAGAAVSMDGRGRWIDNRFIERLWRSVKYEDVYLRDYLDGLDLGRGLGQWFADYNESRPHQALNYACPGDVYRNPESHGARTMK